MGSDGVDEAQLSQVVRPFSLSKCLPKTKEKDQNSSQNSNKRKHRTDKKGRSRSNSGVPASILSKVKYRSTKKDDKKLEELERSFFSDSPPRAKKSKSQVRSSSQKELTRRPPIPSFLWKDDDQESDSDSDIFKPIFPTKKSQSTTSSQQKSNSIIENPKSSQISCKSDNNHSILSDSSKVLGNSCNKENGGDTHPPGNLQSTNLESVTSNAVAQPDDVSANNMPPVSNAQKPKRKRKPRPSQPDHEEIILATDHAFRGLEDANGITIKQIIARIQERYEVTFNATTKTKIRSRLSDLINGKISPTRCDDDPAAVFKSGSSTIDIDKQDTVENHGVLRETSSRKIAPLESNSCVSNSGETKATKKPAVDPSSTVKNQPVEAKAECANLSMKVEGSVNYMSQATANQDEQKHKLPQSGQNPGEGSNKNSRGVDRDDALSVIDITESSDETDEKSDKGGASVKSEPLVPKSAKPKLEQLQKYTKKQEVEQNVPNSKIATAVPEKAKDTNTRKAPARKRAPAKTAPSRNRACCNLCKSCPCQQSNHGARLSSSGILDINKLKHNDAKIERIWIDRIKKLEKQSEQKDSELDKARNKLKSHQREMRRKEQESMPLETLKSYGQYRFLPDGMELDHQLELIQRKAVPVEEAKDVQIKVFGKWRPPCKFTHLLACASKSTCFVSSVKRFF